MTILDRLAQHAEERVAREKLKLPLGEIRRLARQSAPAGGDAFYSVIAKPEVSFICEIKKASPSKGVIDPVFDYCGTATAYVEAGADAVSCLTEPGWFLGSDRIFREVRSLISLPMLRKDFIVDEYQLYQSAVLGADCVLLICALLEEKKLAEYLQICEDMGLAALVETHNEEEIRLAVQTGARMIGVNNRNLKDFSVDLDNAARLRALIPGDCLFVAESGVSGPADAAALRAAGADAILVGEAMMRAPDKGAFLSAMREAAEGVR